MFVDSSEDKKSVTRLSRPRPADGGAEPAFEVPLAPRSAGESRSSGRMAFTHGLGCPLHQPERPVLLKGRRSGSLLSSHLSSIMADSPQLLAVVLNPPSLSRCPPCPLINTFGTLKQRTAPSPRVKMKMAAPPRLGLRLPTWGPQTSALTKTTFFSTFFLLFGLRNMLTLSPRASRCLRNRR